MNLTMMLLLHAYPDSVVHAAGPSSPRPEAPSPEGGEGERVGDDEEADPETLPEPVPRKPGIAPEPGAPDANPIDPRVFGSIH